MEELIVFQTFALEQDAESMANLLMAQGIVAEVVKLPRRIDAVFIGADFTNNYVLKIAGSNFVKANSILYGNKPNGLSTVDASHPLRAMNNEELQAVTASPAEWGPDNYNVALALLEERGAPITEALLAELQHKHIDTLAEKRKLNGFLMCMGYFAAVLPVLRNVLYNADADKDHTFIWYFPGVFGLLLGGSVLIAKTTLPDGRRIMTYDNASIKHGIWMVGINLLSWFVNILVFLYVIS